MSWTYSKPWQRLSGTSWRVNAVSPAYARSSPSLNAMASGRGMRLNCFAATKPCRPFTSPIATGCGRSLGFELDFAPGNRTLSAELISSPSVQFHATDESNCISSFVRLNWREIAQQGFASEFLRLTRGSCAAEGQGEKIVSIDYPASHDLDVLAPMNDEAKSFAYLNEHRHGSSCCGPLRGIRARAFGALPRRALSPMAESVASTPTCLRRVAPMTTHPPTLHSWIRKQFEPSGSGTSTAIRSDRALPSASMRRPSAGQGNSDQAARALSASSLSTARSGPGARTRCGNGKRKALRSSCSSSPSGSQPTQRQAPSAAPSSLVA
jgi:hypothetical protein